MTNPAYQDAFNLLCGNKIASGTTRDVFECRLRPEFVVKVEIDTDWREFANVKEMQFWCDNEHAKNVSKWLAPCEYLSPDGRILLQRRARPVKLADLPDQMPAFLTDFKSENFGTIDGVLVCLDYALHIQHASTRLRNVHWSN